MIGRHTDNQADGRPSSAEFSMQGELLGTMVDRSCGGYPNKGGLTPAHALNVSPEAQIDTLRMAA
ncbi:hypothetical protein EAH76_16795 [Sphingomonas glacialis]|uniref:Uncharacterized protein n=1 Tax=Sphingomonas glacialis TaxID=658225 RepID=A0A502FQV7_9SPHN|nr:hypothetical protein EAH76_16795 [Sphingomonas glacialis]